MRIFRKKYYRRENGQSMVEFAFSAVFILILLVGVVDLGRAFFAYMTIRDAVQEGALYGSTYPNDFEGVKNRVRGTAKFPVDLSDTVNVAVPDPEIIGSACAGHSIKVQTTYTFTLTTPFLGTIIGTQNVPIKASITDTILRPPCY
ncbi:MAG: pilus assembly protein [Anaerolineales bacterium]|nr:pilus assembly protein [Anaerolineales bacterium]